MTIYEMAYTRTDAIDRCANLGYRFIEHFHKVYLNPDSESINHWASEMQSWFDNVLKIRLKHNNKKISPSLLIDWFFTVGSSVEDLFPIEKEADMYELFIIKLLNNLNVKDSLMEVLRSKN